MKLRKIWELLKNSLRVLTRDTREVPTLTDEVWRQVWGVIETQSFATSYQELEYLKRELGRKEVELGVLGVRNKNLEKEKSKEMWISTQVARTTIVVWAIIWALLTWALNKWHTSSELEEAKKENAGLVAKSKADAKRIAELEELTGQQAKIIDLTQDAYKKDFWKVWETIGWILDQVWELGDNVSQILQNSCWLTLDKNIKVWWKNNWWEKINTESNLVDNSQLFYQISNLITELNKTLNNWLSLKVVITPDWNVNVKPSYNWKTFKWFYANSSYHSDRITKEWLERWALECYNRILFMEKVKEIAHERFKNSGFSIKVEDAYSWNVTLTWFDWVKKWSPIVISPVADNTDELILKWIDKAMTSLFDNLPN